MLRAAVGRRGPGHVTGLLPAPWPRRFQAPPSDQPSRVGTLPPTGPSLAPDSASEPGSSQDAVVRTPVAHSGQHPTCPAPPRLAPPPPPPLPAVGEPGATQRLACSPLAHTRHLLGCGQTPRGSLPAPRAHPAPTRMRSKAEGVPPRCTWPSTVTRVSKPSLCTTSCPSGESKAVLAFAARPHCPASPQAPSPGPHPPRPAAGIWGVSSQGPTEPAQGVRSWHVSV